MKYYLDDKQFGRMIITVRRNMKNINITARDGVLNISIPPGVTREYLKEVIDKKRARLAKIIAHSVEKIVSFHDGQTIPYYGGGMITVRRGAVRDGYIHATSAVDRKIDVTVSPEFDFEDEWTKKSISQLISKQLDPVVYQNVQPLLEQTARELGVNYSGFVVGRGLRKFGHCTRQNVIQLSRNVALLPEHLIRYIICHELAHVTHKNHSAAFHALVNQYTGGREKALETELRAFAWPIQR